jgi:large exoprotein involved in heme utilization and adhesion
VRAAKSVELMGTSVDGQFTSGLITSVYPGARGAGGSLTIDTGRLTVRDGAQIIAGTFGQGSGGNLTVTASESVELMGTSPDGQDSSGLYTQSDYFETADNTGSGGELTITTRRLIVEDGAVVSASTFTQGSGGSLSVTALESVELMGTSPDRQVSSGLYTQTQGAGAAGNLTVETEQLTVQDGARVSVSSESSGNAGNLLLTARSIRLDDGGKITATSILGKGGGNINLQDMNLLLLRDNSEISTNAGGTGDGGNINIDTDLLAVFENSNITARAVEGRGGNIRITTQGLFLSPNSKITATSERGIDGVVEINQPDIDPNAELVVLPAQLVDVSGLIAQGCSALGSNVANGESKFVVTGRGGLPPTSREAFNSDAVLEDWGTPALATTQPQRDRKSDHPNHIVSNNATHSTPTPLVEAQGWVIGDNGKVVLTASASNVTSHSSWLTPAACHGN